MKTLRYIGTAMSALVLCMSLTACSDDDDEQGSETYIIQKHIASQQFKYRYDDGYEDYKSATASYDDQNRLIKITDTSGEIDAYEITIDYDKSRIIYTPIDNNSFCDECQLTFKQDGAGCIVEIANTEGGEKAKFTYDSDKHLITSTYSNPMEFYDETVKYTWKNGNLERSKDGDSEVKYEYSDIINKGNIQPYYGYLGGSLSQILPTKRHGNLLLSSGLFGKRSRNLPSIILLEEKYSGGLYSSTSSITYKLDSEGFVVSSTLKDSDGTEETASFTYKE